MNRATYQPGDLAEFAGKCERARAALAEVTEELKELRGGDCTPREHANMTLAIHGMEKTAEVCAGLHQKLTDLFLEETHWSDAGDEMARPDNKHPVKFKGGRW